MKKLNLMYLLSRIIVIVSFKLWLNIHLGNKILSYLNRTDNFDAHVQHFVSKKGRLLKTLTNSNTHTVR